MKKFDIKRIKKSLTQNSKSIAKKNKLKVRNRINFTKFTDIVKKRLPINKYIVSKKFIKSSGLETTFEDYVLKPLNYPYEAQYRIATKFYDFYIPSVKLLIEVDGDYWHGNTKKDLNEVQKKNVTNDFVKNKLAKMNKLNLIRFTEKEINRNVKRCRAKLLQKILFCK